MANPRIQEMERQVLGDIWTTDEPYRTLRELVDNIGHRFGGSESERLGAEFLRERMLAYGLENVRIEEFPVAGWERGSAALKLVTPVERDFSCVAMPYCPSADLTAELLDVGDGELADFQRLADLVPGRIVISAAETNRPGERGSHRNDKYGWAVQHGALAHIFVNQNPGMLHITGSVAGPGQGGVAGPEREAPIPAVGVSWEAGSTILRLIRNSDGDGTVTLKLSNRTVAATSRNVIGEIVGYEKPDEVILLGGHFDGHDISQGAGDDGAGTITGLEAGRALAKLKGQLRRTVRVICFGSEEIGLLGAFHHAAANDPATFRFVMNLDGAGRGAGGQEQLTLSGWPELVTWFKQFADNHHYTFTIQDQMNSHSDHYPFALRGIPNGTLNARDTSAGMIGRGWGHTEADTFDKISLRGLQMSAALVARLAIAISEDDTFPTRHRTQEEVREQLEKENLLERAIAAGRFPA
ncbi:MAG: aminopeptidase [Chloroflexi bacterium]|nr:MAG: aminopeptidase [Chloroflexota bacterium]